MTDAEFEAVIRDRVSYDPKPEISRAIRCDRCGGALGTLAMHRGPLVMTGLCDCKEDAETGTPQASRAREGRILAVDPGTTESGWCVLADGAVTLSGVMLNREVLRMLTMQRRNDPWGHVLAIEMIASYGMPVGREVFETVRWIGRFQQAWHSPEAVKFIYRQDVKLHLCKTPRAKDANVRQALLDMFPRTGGGKTPQIGTKAQPGPLFGVSSHAWAALGVAVTAAHQMREVA